MKNILLGVTGSVAAIKTIDLAEKLQQFATVRLIVTQWAEYFFHAELKTLSQMGVSIYRDEDEWPALQTLYQVGSPILHIELRRWADCLVVAPLDANTLAKISNGICDNLLTSVFRAWDWSKPVILSPAMNTMMWNNQPTGEQIDKLKSWGAMVLEPIVKKLACDDIGIGAMAEVDVIAQFVKEKMEL